MADRGVHNELSGSADIAAQVRTVHGGFYVNGPSMMGVALVFAVVGLVVVAMVRRPDSAPVSGTPGPTHPAIGTTIDRTVEPIWDLLEIPKVAKPLVVARDEAENLVQRTWPADAHLNNVRSSRIVGGVWLRADVVLPGTPCQGVVESMVIDVGDVYSVLVITTQR